MSLVALGEPVNRLTRRWAQGLCWCGGTGLGRKGKEQVQEPLVGGSQTTGWEAFSGTGPCPECPKGCWGPCLTFQDPTALLAPLP